MGQTNDINSNKISTLENSIQNFILDTGSDISFLPKNLVPHEYIKKSEKPIFVQTINNKIGINNYCECKLSTTNNVEISTVCLVLPKENLSAPILGYKDGRNLKFIIQQELVKVENNDTTEDLGIKEDENTKNIIIHHDNLNEFLNNDEIKAVCEANSNVSGICSFPNSEFKLNVTDINEISKIRVKNRILDKITQGYLNNQMEDWVVNAISYS